MRDCLGFEWQHQCVRCCREGVLGLVYDEEQRELKKKERLKKGH